MLNPDLFDFTVNGVFLYTLSLQKSYVTSLVKFSELLELPGEVCKGITKENI